MKESEALVRLQEIDLALMRHKKTLGAMPQARKIQTVRVARKKLASETSKIVGQRKDAEMELAENEKGHARLQEIVQEIQAKFDSGSVGYRELADLEAQLTSLAKRIEKYEYQHVSLSDRLDTVRRAEANARAMDEKLVAEEQAQLRSLSNQTADIKRDATMLAHEREAVVANIGEETMGRYNRACKRFGGLAVETLRGNTPSVCCVAIPPSSFGDVRRGPSITECPYCHRMLVTDGMFDLD